MRSFTAALLPILASTLGLGALCGASPAAAQRLAYETLDLDDTSLSGPGARRSRLMVSGGAVLDVSLPELTGREVAYGPFRVLDGARAALVDATGPRSPAQFSAMLRDYPGITVLEMVECPGTRDDLANLELGRLIRSHGIATHVPSGGSVRSGGVELFLAGSRRLADAGAEFAVHSWIDEDGLQPGDFALSAPVNRRYVDYYRQMGMSPLEAEAFYAMTNSVPFTQARWFGAGVMSLWVPFDGAVALSDLNARS
ncbi:alpha/beta hydrolase [Novosphingobium sp. MBES04]|uniref:alpha/beta hydrolase n=1 Tax=Novosphingobium sp. MBES04 TaxID=1206458 RepID=UPI00057C6BDA|nr:alpha/beta hydrolase [Novosphingobium sp. MBES04]GAM03349.1 alpha/beta hydrolase [Novosphingobium sp. MBES04]